MPSALTIGFPAWSTAGSISLGILEAAERFLTRFRYQLEALSPFKIQLFLSFKALSSSLVVKCSFALVCASKSAFCFSASLGYLVAASPAFFRRLSIALSRSIRSLFFYAT